VSVESRVPRELLVSFNHVTGLDYLANPLAEWDRVRGAGPIVRSDQLGG
jgi:hypothetical protein